jgi:hypothetical protein
VSSSSVGFSIVCCTGAGGGNEGRGIGGGGVWET